MRNNYEINNICGGTGGHIYPAVAIVEEFRNRFKDVEILYVGKKDSMEEEVAKKNGINFKTVRVLPLPRRFGKKLFISLKELLIGINDARKIIKDFKPDVVIGTGGYVSGPVLLAATLLRKKTVIHEQNSLPGITNKFLAKRVDKVLTTYEASKTYLKNKNEIVVTGNPIRNFKKKERNL